MLHADFRGNKKNLKTSLKSRKKSFFLNDSSCFLAKAKLQLQENTSELQESSPHRRGLKERSDLL